MKEGAEKKKLSLLSKAVTGAKAAVAGWAGMKAISEISTLAAASSADAPFAAKDASRVLSFLGTD